MNSSQKSKTTRPDRARVPLIGSLVRARMPLPVKADLSGWIDLMDVIEALCPVWPAREHGTHIVYKH